MADGVVKFAIVAYHVPEPEGTATGRTLWAVGEGLVADGHQVEAWSWSYRPPHGPVPDWCTWRPLPSEAVLRTRARALVRPRSDIVRAGYKPPPDAKLNQPQDVARAVVFALRQPPGCEVRELVVTPSVEGSWP